MYLMTFITYCNGLFLPYAIKPTNSPTKSCKKVTSNKRIPWKPLPEFKPGCV